MLDMWNDNNIWWLKLQKVGFQVITLLLPQKKSYNIIIILRRIAIKKEHDEPRRIISTTQLLGVNAMVIDYA